MIFYKKILFFIITLFIAFFGYTNYFKYNDNIVYFNTDISNSEYLVDLLNEKGFLKNPELNFNNSSCKVFNFIDISNNCNKFIKNYYNKEFLEKIKELINEKN